MAIVKEIKSGSAVVRIDDSCCRGLTPEETERRWAEVERVILTIDRDARRGEEMKGNETETARERVREQIEENFREDGRSVHIKFEEHRDPEPSEAGREAVQLSSP